jgi:hypothetical protein
MALFTDGPIAGLMDLKAYESGILDIASMEGLSLTDKLQIAQREIAIELTSFLLRHGAALGSGRELSTVAVTEPLLHAHVLMTLAHVYRDAYNSQLNERFKSKWREYVQLSDKAFRQLLETGVGIVGAPLPKPALPVTNVVAGGVQPFRSYCVQTAHAGNGATSAWSEPAVVEVQPGTRISVNAPGCHVYAGVSGQPLFRQTTAPLPPGANWTEAETGLRRDLAAVPVQRPDYFVANRRQMLRG